MNFKTTLTLDVIATSTLQADGSISIGIVLNTADADGRPQGFAQAGHHINAADAKPLTDAAPTAAEVAAGLSLRDIVTARGLQFLIEKHRQPLAALLPESLRPTVAAA